MEPPTVCDQCGAPNPVRAMQRDGRDVMLCDACADGDWWLEDYDDPLSFHVCRTCGALVASSATRRHWWWHRQGQPIRG